VRSSSCAKLEEKDAQAEPGSTLLLTGTPCALMTSASTQHITYDIAPAAAPVTRPTYLPTYRPLESESTSRFEAQSLSMRADTIPSLYARNIPGLGPWRIPDTTMHSDRDSTRTIQTS
jgi:hypothetical protein